ncbi:DUF2971 domain-containing protein [Shewanella gelidimarina]|uniref:DUF2971 domain-containing protein n=1 Tax=Shewanella gelidimarina TaxID=56813 RepID=UPI00200EBBB8|nr:DUF2971 domain-containing protein [Shewanella gelidimarina]MCL1058841.1 DUF2971 domain-containing protein [Shewanella gelidimarina]
MADTSDKAIIERIKSRQFSYLDFLEHRYLDEDKPNHIGYYYFILDLKRIDNYEVFNQVVSRYKDVAHAYLYLGKIAHKIYNSFDKHHVAASYYRKAVELDDDCAEAHWGLFRTEKSTLSLYRAIHLDYTANRIKELSHKLINVNMDVEEFSELPIEYWKIVKQVAGTLDEGLLDLLQGQLILAYYFLGEYSKGIEIISCCEQLSINFLLPFWEQGHLSVEDVISKVYEFELNASFENEHENVYQELLKRSSVTGSKINNARLIGQAFKAQAYEKVVIHHEDDADPSKNLSSNFKCNLFYLYSQVHLGLPLNREILSLIQENMTDLCDEEKALYFAVKIREYIAKLTNQLKNVNSNSCLAKNNYNFHKAIKLIELPEVTKLSLHDELKQELDDIELRWNKQVSNHRFIELKKLFEDGGIDENDIIELAGKAISCREFDLIPSIIEKYEENVSPSMTTQNLLGISYEKEGDLKQAIEHYRVALNLMYNSGELNHIIISNYLNCVENAFDIRLTKDEISKLSDDFNIALIDSFKWHFFTAKRRSILFKYSPFNINTVDSLTNQYFYLASKNQLNDPIEMSTKTSISSTLNIGDNYRICCFSNNDNSMLMWSHYAQEHQGIMVEYWFGGELPNGVGVDQVIYSNEAKRKKEENRYLFNQYLLTKNKEWSYEDEVRLFTNQSDKISYEAFDFPNHDRTKINARVSCITMGYKFPEDKKQLVQTIVAAINGKRPAHEPKVTLREAYLSEDDRFTIKYREN